MSISLQKIFFISANVAIFLFRNMNVKAFLTLCALVVVVGISIVQYIHNTRKRECVNINNGQRVDDPLSPLATAYPEVFTNPPAYTKISTINPLKSFNPSISRGMNSSSSNIRSREAAKCCGCARGKCDNNKCRCHKAGVPCERDCHQGIESYECHNSYGVRRDTVDGVE
jgi:hypothetical protein